MPKGKVSLKTRRLQSVSAKRRHAIKNPKERFWSRINIQGLLDCWLWTGHVGSRNGYGYAGINELAHRLAWRYTYGAIPDGMFVLHKCDNRLCVNPGHLFLGTHEDNMRDMLRKDRSTRGIRHYRHKFTAEEVRQLRLIYPFFKNYSAIARAYGVGRECVRKAIRCVTYREVS